MATTTAPQLYALVHRGTPGDLAFYLQACRGVDTVLELGCGHGRLLAPLAAAGHRVTGLDLDRGLLALAAKAVKSLPAGGRVRLVCADMTAFTLEGTFQRILIPYNGLYCLPDRDAQVRCLAAAARHLAPDGLVVFDAYAVDDFHRNADPAHTADDGEPVVSVGWRGATWDVFEDSDWERQAQRLRVRYRYLRRDGGAGLEDTIVHRYLLTGQVRALCADAGLRAVQASGDFNGSPLSGDSEHLVCVAAHTAR